MNYLFLHQNFPAQFRHIAAHLANNPENRVVFITQHRRAELPGVEVQSYTPHREKTKGLHAYVGSFEEAVIAGQGAARVAIGLKDAGFRPDLIVGHPGWGETLFMKDVFPDTPLLSYSEFFYSPTGADVNFDPEFPSSFDAVCRIGMRNAHHLLALDRADRGYSPTAWQRAQFPDPYRDRISVIHDGIDCARVRPDPAARFEVPGGPVLQAGDEVLLFIGRNLELYRGFHIFMRAMPEFMRLRPAAQVVVVGGDEAGYGRAAPSGTTWREVLLKETDPPLNRIHFVGRLPYGEYLRLQQVARARIYLTYPFVLSWSMLESMAAGCLIIGSDTPPVTEVIEDGVNGRLVNFFDAGQIAKVAAEAMEKPEAHAGLREAARATVLERYEWRTCRDRLLALMQEMT